MKFAAALIAAAMIVGSSAQSSGSTCILDCPSTYEPVCGDNGVTYPNECALDNDNCLLTNGNYISTKSEGPCPIDGSGSSCILNCPATYEPVCGDNGVTYHNECALDNANCLLTNGGYIFTKSQGSCSK